MSQWLTILFGLLLNQFWFKSCDLGFVKKLWCYTLFPKSFRFLCYVISSHQFDLSKSCKHWDIFLSHCNSYNSGKNTGFWGFPAYSGKKDENRPKIIRVLEFFSLDIPLRWLSGVLPSSSVAYLIRICTHTGKSTFLVQPKTIPFPF